MARHEIGDPAEIPPGDYAIVEVGRSSVGVFNIDGDYHALPNVCPHQYGPLCSDGPVSDGTITADRDDDFELKWDLEGEVVACPWHDLQFHVPTGRCLATADWDFEVSYDVFVEDGVLVLET